MNFDVHRNNQLNDYLDLDCGCDPDAGEFCHECDPAEAEQRDMEERSELRSDY